MLKTWLEHPLTRGKNLDDPSTTWLRREIIEHKRFLRRIYEEWYTMLAAAVARAGRRRRRWNSARAPGSCHEYIDRLITTEIFRCPDITMVLDACALPFEDRSLRAVVMTDVLHHIPRVRDFFAEAGRCVQPGGVVAMIEPWVTSWSRLIYTKLHHEPFRPDTGRVGVSGERPAVGRERRVALGAVRARSRPLRSGVPDVAHRDDPSADAVPVSRVGRRVAARARAGLEFRRLDGARTGDDALASPLGDVRVRRAAPQA